MHMDFSHHVCKFLRSKDVSPVLSIYRPALHTLDFKPALSRTEALLSKSNYLHYLERSSATYRKGHFI